LLEFSGENKFAGTPPWLRARKQAKKINKLAGSHDHRHLTYASSNNRKIIEGKIAPETGVEFVRGGGLSPHEMADPL